METKQIELKFAELTFMSNGIVELHFSRNEAEVTVEEIQQVFDIIKAELRHSKCYLLVSTVQGAQMSPAARDLASSEVFNEVSAADAIIRSDYSHEMAANFFIRVNKPGRPVQLFPSRQRAETWLLEQMDNTSSAE